MEEAKAQWRLGPAGGPQHSLPQALTFIIFICFTASISAYMAAALLEFFITLAFLFLYATQYHQRFDRLNWPCLVSARLSPPALLSCPWLAPTSCLATSARCCVHGKQDRHPVHGPVGSCSPELQPHPRRGLHPQPLSP